MTHINQRRDSAANWASENPVLHLGEVGWEVNTRKAKIGDGSTAWNDLDYIVEEGVTSVNGQTGVVTIDAADIGLGNVDDTPDMSKPVSTLQQAALDDKADIDSPVFTGDPQAPTPAFGDSSSSLATTEWVQTEMVDSPAPEMLIYEADDVFTKSTYPGLKALRVRVLGGGGAGAGSAATAAGESSAGNGGSSGGYSEVYIDAADLSPAENITVGAGGTPASGAAGGDGGESSFTTFATAPGGFGGTSVMPADTIPDMGAGSAAAVVGTGDLTTPGAGGEGVTRVDGVQIRSGKGGDSVLGPGGRALCDVNSNGIAGYNGSGGSGGISRNGEGAHSGGVGGNGLVTVELIY